MTWIVALIVGGLTIVAERTLLSWRRIKVAEALARQAEAQCRHAEVRAWQASADRFARQVRDFQVLTGAHRGDNIQPVTDKPHLVKSDVVIPFGKKPSNPEGAA